MSRATSSVHRHAKRKKVLKLAKGYRGRNSSNYRIAKERVEKLNFKKELGAVTLDLVLRAQRSVANAESAYYQQVVAYNKALVNLNLATGSLLEYNGVYLAEGHWVPDAYSDAQIRAAERTHAKPNPHLHTEPPAFVSPRPTGSVERRVVVPPSSVPETSVEEFDTPAPPGGGELTEPPTNE